MARVLVYTSPARGHLYPLAGTLVELHRRGHEIHVRTLASELDALRAVGLQAERIDPAIEAVALDDWRASTPEEGLAGALRTFAERARHEVPDVRTAIDDVEPDVLLVDVTTAGAAAVAEAGAIPWSQWIPFFQHVGLDAGATRRPTLIPYTLAPAGLDVLNAPRREVGLPPLTDPAAAWRAPLYLYFTAAPFEPPEVELPASFRFVGPGLWEPPAEAPSWFAELEDPLVLVSASSEYQRDDALVQTALDALAPEDVRVVVTTAAHNPDRFATPPNARVERWLPHGPLLRRAACVVCHGGMGVTQRALAAGVPVCVVPFGRDQWEVAARVTAAGGGTHIPPHTMDAATLRAAIDDAMTMRHGARRIAAGLERAGGAPAAASAVEGLLDDTGAREPATATSAGG